MKKNKNEKKKKLKKGKDVFVSILLTESTTSFLKMNLPHVNCVHPENSKLFVISPEHFNKKENATEEKDEKGNDNFTKCKRFSEAGPSKAESYIGINKNVQTSVSKTSLIYGTHLKMSSDIGLFKSNFSSESSCMYEGCDSNEELEDQLERENKSAIFETRKVKPLPLLSVRTTAHSNKLVANDSATVFVSLLDASLNSSEYICRICHGGESLDDLITPCRCRGTVALVHLKCLERWLKDSQHSSCELCQHHFRIVRKPKYSVAGSIPAYLREPGPQMKDVLLDLVAFAIYTPSAVASTYMLMILCESLVKSNVVTTGTFSAHLLAFSAVFGMAAIDFTYSSWLLYTCQRHVENWREWFNCNTTLKVVLSPIKLRPHKKPIRRRCHAEVLVNR